MRFAKYIHAVAAVLLSLFASPMLFAQKGAVNDQLEIALHGTIAPEKIGTHETQSFMMPKGIAHGRGA